LRRIVTTLGIVWLTAFNLRVILFAIPPTLPEIRSDLGLSYFATGSITSLAVLALGVASIPGALLATRFGARRLVTVCAAGLAVFAAAITLPPGAFWVFAGSALLTLSIAIAQPPLAVLIRRWFPTTITRASNLYANGLLMGNVLGASLSPFISHVIGWRSMFLVWAAVAAIGVALWVRFTPRDDTAAPPVNLGKVLRDPRVWLVAALFTFQNLVYYTVATWVPFLLGGHSAADIATTFLFLTFFPIVPLFALNVRALAVRAVDMVLRRCRRGGGDWIARPAVRPHGIRAPAGLHGRAGHGRRLRRLHRASAADRNRRK